MITGKRDPQSLCLHGMRLLADLEYTQAEALFLESGKKGYPAAWRCLGQMKEKGQGCIADLSQAQQYYAKAVELGDVYGEEPLAAVRKEIRKRLEEGLSLRDEEAVYRQAEQLFDAHKPGYAALYMEAGSYGNPDAMFMTGYCLANGLDCRPSWEAGLEWYEKAADAGNSYGMYYVAVCCAQGKGCRRNTDRALLYARKARRAGNRDALTLIPQIEHLMALEPAPVVYRMDQHKEADMRELRRIISRIVNRSFYDENYVSNLDTLARCPSVKKIDSRQAAETAFYRAGLGDPVAMYRIGCCYLEKDPTELNPSPDKGYEWLMKSAKAGFIPALKTLITLFADGDPGPFLVKARLEDHGEVQQDLDYAWDLLRLLGWIHVDGLLTLEYWYENGLFREGPDYLEALEACKTLQNYRVVPKKYLPGWQKMAEREKQRLQQEKTPVLLSMILCQAKLGTEGYLGEAEEAIRRTAEENPQLLPVLGIRMAAAGLGQMAQLTASLSREAAMALSDLYCTGLSRLPDGTVKKVRPDYESSVLFRFYPPEGGSREPVTAFAEEIAKAYRAQEPDQIISIPGQIRDFLRQREAEHMPAPEFDLSVFGLLPLSPDPVNGWREGKLSRLKDRYLQEAVYAPSEEAGQKAAERLKDRWKNLDLFCPDSRKLFSLLPMAAERENHRTYCEELINQNYDLSSYDFSAADRLDVRFDGMLWRAAEAARSYGAGMLGRGICEWQLPEEPGIDLDNGVEDYLDHAAGKILGYWPGLAPVALVHYTIRDSLGPVRKAKFLDYRQICRFPEKWTPFLTEDSIREEEFRQYLLQDGEPVLRRSEEYVRRLLLSERQGAEFADNLRKLYRYICFRELWEQAVSGATESSMTEGWRQVYRYFAGQWV